jgi:hypothetical protein
MDLERRQRQEDKNKRFIINESKKRVNMKVPPLFDERSRLFKRRRVGMEIVLDDMEKENNYKPMISVFSNSFDSHEAPSVPSLSSSSLASHLTCTLRPRNLNAALESSLSRRLNAVGFHEHDEPLPYMPL